MKNNDNVRIALVTGAARGIGYAIVKAVATNYTHLVVASKRKPSIMKAARRLRNETDCEVIPMWGDLEDPQAVAKIARESVEKVAGKLDLLVLNAGYFIEGSLEEISVRDFERNMMVNCHSAHYLVSALLPLMSKSAGARIVIIGSTAAYEPYPLVPTYGIAKWGLRGYAINLRKELMCKGIAVSFVSPGGTLTDMWAGIELPARRLLEPEDIGKMVAAIVGLSPQAVVEEVIVRPMLGDIHE